MGDVFAGRYELVDPLGEGGSGVVWRVWDHKLHQFCAAKVLRQVDASSLMRFMREQSLRLDHEHVLAPTGWAGEDDKVLFTMPIASGGSVATLVSDFGPLPSQLVALLLDQLLAALEAIHAEGIVHRDVKPANLLLAATGTARPHLQLSDFGIAAGVDAPRLTQGPFTMGTPGYVAPESRVTGWHPDARADLYAAGMCALEMLTALTPEFDADVVQALTDAIRDEPVPQSFVAVVAQLADHDPDERYDSAAAARAALQGTGLLPVESNESMLAEVEVFDLTPPLPPRWSQHGPLSAAGRVVDPGVHGPPQPADRATQGPAYPGAPPNDPAAPASDHRNPNSPSVPSSGIGETAMEAAPHTEAEVEANQVTGTGHVPPPAAGARPTRRKWRDGALALALIVAGLLVLASSVYQLVR